MINKISRKIGFTDTESKIVLFLLAAFLIGITVNIIKDQTGDKNLLQYDYSSTDSLFLRSNWEDGTADSLGKIAGNGFDSKRELLDFTGEKFSKTKIENTFAVGAVVNINVATVQQLSSLPGIGVKTARAIVEYRSKFGKFVDVNALLNVKGIGKIKFEKIKKFISVN